METQATPFFQPMIFSSMIAPPPLIVRCGKEGHAR